PVPGVNDDERPPTDLIFDPARPHAAGGLGAVAGGTVLSEMLVNMQLNGWAVLQLQTPFSDTHERLKIDSKYGYVKIFLAYLDAFNYQTRTH
ncbi:hypothetical protein PPTG_25014, partial [Phytophthora nicotianae INRA-310]